MNKDPSHNGMYTQWMLIQYLKGNFLYEDSGNLLDDLEYFHVNKRAFTEKDINQYTVDSLYAAKKQIEDQAEPAQSKRQEKIEIKKGAEKVLETENVLVITPKNNGSRPSIMAVIQGGVLQPGKIMNFVITIKRDHCILL